MTMGALGMAKLLEDGLPTLAILHVSTIKPLNDAVVIEPCNYDGHVVIVAEYHRVWASTVKRWRVRRSARVAPSHVSTSSSTPARCRRYAIDMEFPVPYWQLAVDSLTASSRDPDSHFQSGSERVTFKSASHTRVWICLHTCMPRAFFALIEDSLMRPAARRSLLPR